MADPTNQTAEPWGSPGPWRISADDINDAIIRYGINPFFVEIMLDGEIAQSVIIADQECGLIVQQKYDSSGHLVVVDGELVREIRYGKVEITLKWQQDGSWPHFGQRRPERT